MLKPYRGIKDELKISDSSSSYGEIGLFYQKTKRYCNEESKLRMESRRGKTKHRFRAHS